MSAPRNKVEQEFLEYVQVYRCRGLGFRRMAEMLLHEWFNQEPMTAPRRNPFKRLASADGWRGFTEEDDSSFFRKLARDNQ